MNHFLHGNFHDSVLIHIPLNWNLNFLDNFLYPILINYSVLIYNSILVNNFLDWLINLFDNNLFDRYHFLDRKHSILINDFIDFVYAILEHNFFHFLQTILKNNFLDFAVLILNAILVDNLFDWNRIGNFNDPHGFDNLWLRGRRSLRRRSFCPFYPRRWRRWRWRRSFSFGNFHGRAWGACNCYRDHLNYRLHLLHGNHLYNGLHLLHRHHLNY
mmetsp:Transcript_8592/g.18507  ORF Transcript_8592/g.18507 Transcript_8592/m.18507 type:complete len:215 (+) Transcript_8592:1466-2110(+)